MKELADFGVLLVMFAIGLEFRISKLISVLPMSGLTGLIQVSFLMWCGFSVGQLIGWTTVESIFLGASIAISSTMIVSKVFEESPVAPKVRQYVLGVLVVQDVLAIVLIAATTAVAAGGGLTTAELMTTLGGLAAVLFGLVVGGLLVVPRFMRAVERLRSPEILAVVSVGLCFGLAELAAMFGYSVALGAFIAGMLVAESGQGPTVEHLVRPLRDVFAAVFFVSVGMTVDPLQAMDSSAIALLVFVVVVVGQFVSVTTVGLLSGNGLSRSVTAALSLGQVGEFGFIIAAIGLEASAVRPELQSVVVTVAVLTAFTTSLFFKQSDRVVNAMDRWVPKRVQHLLSVQEAWVERTRAAAAARPTGLIRRAVRAAAFDAAVLIMLAGLSLALQSEVCGWVQEHLEVTPLQARSLAGGVMLLVAAPFLAALFRNAGSVSRLVSTRILPPEGDPPPSAKIAARALRITLNLLIVLAVGSLQSRFSDPLPARRMVRSCSRSSGPPSSSTCGEAPAPWKESFDPVRSGSQPLCRGRPGRTT